MKILFASTNRGKYSELKSELGKSGIALVHPSEVLSLYAGLGALPDVDEDALTYEGNAIKKAESAARWLGSKSDGSHWILADDTGLEVEILGGDPGIRSARYAGPEATAQENREFLKQRLARASAPGEARFKARFVCVLVCIPERGEPVIVEDELRGFVCLDERGEGGFGYDPMFEVGDTGKTLAELKHEGQDVPTHRIKAIQRLIAQLHPV